ncbi:MAG: hypothetical protein IVW55_00950 [Chloroflexi bacterium]|nr:hypothetical protein [Chloroflexota bacterium]
MPVLLTLFALAMACLALAYVLAPLRGKRGISTSTPAQLQPSASKGGDPVAALLEQREAAIAGLAELDFDYTLGNLNEADYRDLKVHYRDQAIGVLQRLEQAGVREQVGSQWQSAEAVQATSTKAPQSSSQGTQLSTVNRRRFLRVTSGLAVLGMLVFGTMAVWLANSRVAPAAEDAPALPVLHTHAALLVPGTQVVLIGHHEGLLRSSDSGRSWLPVQGVAGDVLAFAGASAKGDAIFLTTSEQVMRSDDEGLTWLPLPLPVPKAQIQAIATGPGVPQPLYASVRGAGLYRTNDQKEWNLVGDGLPTNAAALVWQPGSYSAFYAASPGDGLLASSDGRAWGSASGVLNGVLPTLAVRTVAVDPASGDRFQAADGTLFNGAIYVGTDLGLFKSIDGGSSWSSLSLQQSLVAVSARSQPDPLILAVDSRARLWRSQDRGLHWSAQP